MKINKQGGYNLDGRVAVVTGGAGGIGQAICNVLAQAGAFVYIVYKSSESAAQALQNEIESSGGKATALPVDVTQKTEVDELFKNVSDSSGKLDILVNNAGVYPVSGFQDISEDEYDLMMNANLRSVFLCSQSAANVMAQNDGGVIINIASIAASGVLDMHSHYCAAKSAVVSLTRSTARELGKHNIRVNAVSPGLIWRPGLEQDWPEGVERFKQAAALNRVGRAEDVARACLFLASDDAGWITGIDLVVDGGVMTDKIF